MKYDAPIIIGLAGPAGSGKDTVRQMLESDHGFSGLAFADPLRDMVIALLDHVYANHYATRRDLKEVDVPVIGASYRKLAQTLGTEWGRQTIRESLWVDIAMAKTRLAMARGEHVVISDVRFPNEVEAIRSHGGVIWAVTRPQLIAVRDHVSEALARSDAAGLADHIICNDGTLGQLRERVANAVGSLT